ncbi:hypothetical protein BDB01DRAFT_894006 [Pilobolus umbonatus]|nr:hypothetical protein BDB01DRAFT_894006 [Pilobolus umbonatus]
MALPAKIPKTKGDGLAPSTNRPLNTLSWSRIVSNNRKSLIHSTSSSTSENEEKNKTITSRIWRAGHGEGSVMVDMSSQTISKVFSEIGFGSIPHQAHWKSTA